jgi:hypothetical protein
MWYYAGAGPALGLLMFGIVRNEISVLESPDDLKSVGTALCCGLDAAGVALWRLMIRGAELHGKWIVVDREFRPAR